MPNLPAFGEALMAFVFYYPLFMAYLWMAGAIYYWFHYERRANKPDEPPPLERYPSVAVIVPCRNEEAHASETIERLMASKYPELEVIAVDDGSTASAGMPRSLPVSTQIASLSASPPGAQTLEILLLTTIAPRAGPARRLRPTITGAPGKALRVNIAAKASVGSSRATSVTVMADGL